ncbi:MAG: twin-arginine translocase TatA/TatE family subunit [Chitinophagaceae bacterium]|nr:twin-arginine translocase TatA/TatE family subunit [Chitinophagaceae bacterium]MDB5222677.1 twin-arginine translocase TatA/TatE family subunit [Chitinophagaceae bacterium]
MLVTFLNTFLLSMPGGSEWILILLVVLLFFGGRKIPDLMRGIGRGVREFNDAKTNVKNEIEAGMSEKDKKEQDAELELKQAQERLMAAQAKVQQAQATQMQTELPK